MSTHNRIRELRKEKGLSQKEFAKAFNEFSKDDENIKTISYATVSRWENEENEPKLDVWIKLADFFSVPVSYLQGLSDINYKDVNELRKRTLKNYPDFAKKISNSSKFTPFIHASELGSMVRDNVLSNYQDVVYKLLGSLNKGLPLTSTDLSDWLIKKYKEKAEIVDEEEINNIIYYLQLSLLLMLSESHNYQSIKEKYKGVLDSFYKELRKDDEINRY